MAMSSLPTSESSDRDPEVQLIAPDVLVDYIRDQFEIAYRSGASDSTRDRVARNGSFLKIIPFVEVDENEPLGTVRPGIEHLLSNTAMIVMREPFTMGRPDRPLDFVELYAIFLRGTDGHIVSDVSGAFADQFLVREHTEQGYEPFVRVTEDGAFPVDLDLDFDPVRGFDVADVHDHSVEDIEAVMAQASAPVVEASRLFELLSRYNPVAISNDPPEID